MKTKLYVAIAILCAGLSTGGSVFAMSYTNNTTNAITVSITTSPNQKKPLILTVAPGATQNTPGSLSFPLDTTQITISDSKSPSTSFNYGKYWCADLRPESVQARFIRGSIDSQIINSYTITNSKNALIVTPSANSCPLNWTSLVNTYTFNDPYKK